jgi:hypothetical protein
MAELFEYITTTKTDITNNNGRYVETWPENKKFTTGAYINNNKLYLGTDGVNNVNRWISVGTYIRVLPTDPPPVDPPPVVLGDEEINIRKFAKDRVTVLESKWYKEVVE